MNDNRISATLTTENKTAALAAIEALKANLPGLIALTKEQRVRMLKFGGSSVDFVARTYAVAANHAQYLPPVFDMAEWQKDVELFQALREIADILTPLVESIDDTLMEAGAEAYSGALAAYQYLKSNHLGGELDGLLDELGKKFARKSGAQKATTSTPSTSTS